MGRKLNFREPDGANATRVVFVGYFLYNHSNVFSLVLNITRVEPSRQIREHGTEEHFWVLKN